MELQIVDCREKDFDMQDELFGLTNGFEVLAAADLAQHVGDASCA